MPHFIFNPSVETPWDELLRHARGKSITKLPDFFGVDRRTVQRWKSENRAPLWAKRLLIFRCGHLGILFPEWHGWYIDGDDIVDENGFHATKHIIWCSQMTGTQVTQAKYSQNQAEKHAEELRTRLAYITQCLAGYIVAQRRPRIDETFEVYEDQQPQGKIRMSFSQN